MTAARLPQLGSVNWAEVERANSFRKVRPAIVITPTAEIAAGQNMRIIAITTRLPSPLPDDHVLLPWHRDGKVRTGLRRKCAAVTSWRIEIGVSDVQQIVGVLPPATIEELLSKIVADAPPPPIPSDKDH